MSVRSTDGRPQDARRPENRPFGDRVLDVRGLEVRLGSGATVVERIDLHTAPGELLGIVGESGSGKTTIATALLGHARPGARIVGGEVLVAGTDVLGLRGAALTAARGALVGYVPQDPATSLNPRHRVGTHLDEALRVHEPVDVTGRSGRRARRDGRRERALRALEEVGLPAGDEFLARFPHQLSGGQQQRVLLALAFALRPRVVVLDEPTTALDVTTQARIVALVRRLCREHEVAAVYVSHDLAVVAQLADRVAVVRGGRIVETAPVARFFARPEHSHSRALLAAVPGAERVGAGERRSDAGRLALAVPRPVVPAGGLTPAVPAPLEVDGLSVGYGRTTVVHDVSLRLLSGACVGVIGESGSGKTTLARAIVGLGDRVEGAVRLDGRGLATAVADRSADDRRGIQYVFQNPYRALNPRQTVGEVLRTPLRHFHGLRGAAADARVAAALERVALPAALVDVRPTELSGGERQRVAIARALAAEPTVLVCDEISSALDMTVQERILALLRELQADGLALLFVTHDLGLVRELADQIVVLRSGRVVEAGPTGAVLDDPRDPYTRQLAADTPRLPEPVGRELPEAPNAPYPPSVQPIEESA